MDDPLRCSLDESCKLSRRTASVDVLAELELGASCPTPASAPSGPPPSPLVLSWHNVTAFVTTKPSRRWLCGSLPKRRCILHALSGVVSPTSLSAIMGPSGSGKTTLLSLLGDRGSGTEVEGALAAQCRSGPHLTLFAGTILANGAHITKALRRTIGFVTQDDDLWATLTVQQTLTFAAALRLPEAMPPDERQLRVEEVVAALQLQKCRDTPIGGPFSRGVSGGERKRCAIGLELLTRPSALLLDEPTSGLDSSIAFRLVSALADLAAAGASIALSIHQPSSRVFAAFSEVILLAEGRTLYCGSPAALGAYLEPLGAPMPHAMNPADWLIDLASAEPAAGGEAARSRLLNAYAAGSREAAAAKVERTMEVPETRWPTSWGTQVAVLVRRNFAARRDSVFDPWRLLQVFLVGLLTGLLWVDVARQPVSLASISDTAGYIFFAMLFLIFLAQFGALFAFPMERAITIKERRSGFYMLSAYYAARSLSDLPLDLAVPMLFLTPLYFTVGLAAHVFVQHLLVVLLSVFVATSLGLLISAVCTDLKQAQTFASVSTLTFMLCGGFYISGIPPWLTWLRWLSFISHGYAAALKLQYPPDATYPCGAGRCLARQSPRLADTDWAMPASGNVGILLAELVLLRVLTYFALRWRLR